MTDPVGLSWGDHERSTPSSAIREPELRSLPSIPEEGNEEPLGAYLDEVEEGRWSWTWHVPEDVRQGRRSRDPALGRGALRTARSHREVPGRDFAGVDLARATN